MAAARDCHNVPKDGDDDDDDISGRKMVCRKEPIPPKPKGEGEDDTAAAAIPAPATGPDTMVCWSVDTSLDDKEYIYSNSRNIENVPDLIQKWNMADGLNAYRRYSMQDVLTRIYVGVKPSPTPFHSKRNRSIRLPATKLFP